MPVCVLGSGTRTLREGPQKMPEGVVGTEARLRGKVPPSDQLTQQQLGSGSLVAKVWPLSPGLGDAASCGDGAIRGPP